MAHCRWVGVGQDIHRTPHQAPLPKAINRNCSPSACRPPSPLLLVTEMAVLKVDVTGAGDANCSVNEEETRRIEAACGLLQPAEFSLPVAYQGSLQEVHTGHRNDTEKGMKVHTSNALPVGLRQRPRLDESCAQSKLGKLAMKNSHGSNETDTSFTTHFT